MKEKHFFAGANTGYGFDMRFDEINTNQGLTYILKGGSGNGKSTLMKTVGKHFLKKGFDVEFVHCSTDPKSLDGIKITQKNILILDGTNPHVVEAKAVAVTDKILNIGAFVKDDILKEKEKIIKILDEKSQKFKVFYQILQSTLGLLKVQELMQKNEKQDCETISHQIFNELNLPKIERDAKNRNLFLSAIGGDGTINLLAENNFKTTKVVKTNLFQFSNVVSILKEKVLQSGFDCICFLNPLNPSFCDAFCVPAISFCLVLEEEQSQNAQVLFCQNQIKKMLCFASKVLLEARSLHQKLEEIYITHTNFKEIDKFTKKLVTEIEQRIKPKEWKITFFKKTRKIVWLLHKLLV